MPLPAGPLSPPQLDGVVAAQSSICLLSAEDNRLAYRGYDVAELAEHAGISLALLCHHGSVLVEGGLVTKRKVGQTSYWLLERGALDAAMRSVGLPPALA